MQERWEDQAVRALIDGLPDPVVCFMLDGTITYSNEAHDRLLSRPDGSAVGMRIADLLPARHREAVTEGLAAMGERIAGEGGSGEAVFAGHTITESVRDGEPVFCEWTNQAYFDVTGELLGIMAVGRDITRERLDAVDMDHQARHDALTGVLSRHGVQRHLSQRWKDAAADEVDLTLVYLDLDGFKEINDTLGHDAGDATLVAVGDVLRSAVRPGDAVGRMGGDEFVLILHGVVAPQVPRARMATVTTTLGQLDIPVGASYGVARPRPGEGWQQLLARADARMYADKSRRRRRAHVAIA